MNAHAVKDVMMDVMVSSSVLHTFLPPWDADAFQPFPTFQKYYKLLIYVIGYIGFNARSTVYKSISVSNANGVNYNNNKEAK